jgi:hypothetical protein
VIYIIKTFIIVYLQGADKSLAQPTSLSIVFSVQGTGGSPTGPDPETRVGDQDIGSPSRLVSSGLQVPGEPFFFLVGLRNYLHLCTNHFSCTPTLL